MGNHQLIGFALHAHFELSTIVVSYSGQRLQAAGLPALAGLVLVAIDGYQQQSCGETGHGTHPRLTILIMRQVEDMLTHPPVVEVDVEAQMLVM